jgi:UDP-glucose:(heptosyl)LPS alpha-1,3-glucosyltransferase
LRIAVISPAVDRQHGTERAVTELVDRLHSKYGDQIELYAERVSDLTLTGPLRAAASGGGAVHWHRIRAFPGPHLFRFVGWLVANCFASKGRSELDVVFSAGINSFDADVILVHVVFHRVAELQKAAGGAGLRALHRRIYYALLCCLERRIYKNPRLALAAVSERTASQLRHYFQRADVAVISNGVDGEYFSAPAIAVMRPGARARWGFSNEDFVLVLIGNDWRNKGLTALLAAMAKCARLPVKLMVVGQDDPAPFRDAAEGLGVANRVLFCPPAADVRTYYAGADTLVAPSLEDSFNLPVLEAMSCGLPVIVSPHAGISQCLKSGHDCLLLRNPEDAGDLAAAIRQLASDPAKRKEIAINAMETAAKFSWDSQADAVRKLLVQAADAKRERGKD